MSDSDSIIPDGWEFVAGGRACLWLDGRPHRLKAPKLGELRAIAEQARDTQDATAETARLLQARSAEMAEAVEAGTMTAVDRSDEMRAINRQFNEQTETAWWPVLRYIADTLGSGFPGEDDLPGWVVVDAMNEVTTLLRHFQTSPPPRGGRP